MITIILFGVTLGAVGLSFGVSRDKTRRSFLMAKNMFAKMIREILAILALIGLILALLPEEVIARYLGGDSHALSVVWGGLVGTITILPGVIAFPLAAELVAGGAHLAAVAAFITTLTMVGVATLPMEIRNFGRPFALVRNGLSFIFALAVALLMGVIL